MEDLVLLQAARAGSQSDFAALAEPHRRALQVHCYRMLGSLQDAEDMVQETLLRAWQKLNTYEGRASFRAWLYKIATNLCIDELGRRPKRTLPPARQPASDPSAPPAPPITEPIWLEPIPEEWSDEAETPDVRYDARESITLAFLVALHALPPRQRAVLILCDVLDWHADETAQTLGLTVPAVNSALHRARVTLGKYYHAHNLETVQAVPSDDKMRALLDRYMQAWENADIDALISLLNENATFPMPPFPMWYQGREAIRTFIAMAILAGVARGRFHLVPIRANAQPAFALYQKDMATGTYHAFAIQVLTFDGALIEDATTFGNPGLFPRFGLPLEWQAKP